MMSSLYFCISLTILLGVYAGPVEKTDSSTETAETWNAIAWEELSRTQHIRNINKRARNVILFLGDGMGISTLTAARILKGKEESALYFEKFPNSALSKTYCADSQVTDSAASSTAFQCGVKNNKGVLGLDPRVKRFNCSASLNPEYRLKSILDYSLEQGKSVGLVTTTRITHATPGGAYAKSADRDWEGDKDLTEQAKREGCIDIALQLLTNYTNIQVVMGGGRQYFLPSNATDPNTGKPNKDGRRDQRDLTQEWQDYQRRRNRNEAYVWNATSLRNLDINKIDYLLGLFSESHMSYEKARKNDVEPSLAEMTEVAIKILNRNPKGFYLMVEGGRIDMSHHENNAYNALYDTLAFADAIEKAGNLTSEEETLTVTTADHSHTLVIAGYPKRGSGIFDIVTDPETDRDNSSFSTLLYGDGPGYKGRVPRANLNNSITNNPKYQQESVVPLSSSTHGGEDVAIYAKGPMAHLFRGIHEQNYIAHVMEYASCVGNYTQNCPPAQEPDNSKVVGSSAERSGCNVTCWIMQLLVMLIVAKFKLA